MPYPSGHAEIEIWIVCREMFGKHADIIMFFNPSRVSVRDFTSNLGNAKKKRAMRINDKKIKTVELRNLKRK